MQKRVASRKFMSPPLKGDKYSVNEVGNDGGSTSRLSEERKLKEKVSRTLSDSQYEDLFNSVLEHTQVNPPNIQRADVNNEEDEVAVPEPNAALSPAESAEECPNESPGNAAGKAVKTPDQRIDNSVLPPIKRKKPVSKIAHLHLKVRPTKLNFDDPALIGEPDNLPNSKKSNSLPTKTSQKPKTSSNPSDCSDLMRPNKPHPKKKSWPRTPDVKGSQQNEFRTPTGRVLNDSQLSTGSIGHGGANFVTPNSSQLLCSQSSSVQMMTLSPRSRLFRLQRKRNVGLWVQCTNKNCTKWRYLPSTRDPTEVPDNWQCYMNHDRKYASCSAPEKGPTPVEEEDLIHNQYTAGSVVWGRLAGYPWWPAIVDDDPDVEQYYWVTETCDIPTHYNVAFFDDKPVTRAWLTPGAITKYSRPTMNKDVWKTSANGTNYSRRLEVAKNQAEEALKLSVDERLKKFSFVARYKGPIGKKRYPSDSEDDEIFGKSVKRAGKVPKKDYAVSEEDPIIDITQSLEMVKELNQALNELISEPESENDEELEKGPLSAKYSGMAKDKEEVSLAKSMVGKDDKRKEMKQKKKKSKEAKKDYEEKSEGKQDNEKEKQDVTDNVEFIKDKKKNKESKRNKKKKEIKDEDGEIKKGKEKNEGINKNKVTNKDVDAAAKTKLPKHANGDRAVKDTEVQHNKSLGKGHGNKKPEGTDKDYGKLSSNGIGNEEKTKKKNRGKVQREMNNSETRKSESHSVTSSAEHHLSGAEKVQSVNDKKFAFMERDGKSISPDFSDTDEVVSECETAVDRGTKEDGTTSSGEETDPRKHISASSGDDESEADESNAQPSPSMGSSCGRTSADLFEPQQCSADQVSASSQHSADFDVEE